MGTRENEEVDALVTEILADYDKGRDIDKTDFYDRPEREEVRKITDSLLKIMYPGYYRDRTIKSYNAYGNLTVLIEDVLYNLSKQILCKMQNNPPDKAGKPRPMTTGGCTFSRKFCVKCGSV